MGNIEDLGHHAQQIAASLDHATQVLPDFEVVPKRAWISETTLGLISQRKVKHIGGDHSAVKGLHKQVRASAKKDKQKFLDNEVLTGGWQAIKRLRMVPAKKYATIRNAEGDLVGSNLRADTMAAYFQNVQWKVQFANLVP